MLINVIKLVKCNRDDFCTLYIFYFYLVLQFFYLALKQFFFVFYAKHLPINYA